MNWKKILVPAFFSWLPLAFTITALSGLIYVAGQQNYRQNANDPQIQLVEDYSTQIAAGAPVESLNTEPKVDPSKSLSTFILIYDKNGKLLAANASLNEKTPEPPSGVIEYAKFHGENRVTWAPQKDVRTALVVKHFKGNAEGYIAIGRSLKEIEKRETKLALLVAIGWAVTLIGGFLLKIVPQMYYKKAKK